jgi:hypothetical protein
VALLVVATGGCRCGRREPPSDLVELVPGPAVFVLELDLAGLRQAPVMAALGRKDPKGRERVGQSLGFQPTRDLHRVVVAAAGREDGQLDYLVLLMGRFKRGRVLEALERRGGKLVHKRRSGQTVYRERSGAGPQLLFPGRRTMVLVSPGWLELLLQRLRGRGRSVLAVNPPLAAQIRAGRAGKTGAWLASQLSAATSRLLASRMGWPELSQVAAIQGSVRADQLLRLEAWLSVEREGQATALEARLRGVAGPLRRMKVLRQGRRVRVRLALTPEEIEAVLDKLRSPARQTEGPGG